MLIYFFFELRENFLYRTGVNILKMFLSKISENTEMLSLYTNTAMCIGLKMRFLSISRKSD